MKTCSRNEEYINLDDENSLKYLPNYISLCKKLKSVKLLYKVEIMFLKVLRKTDRIMSCKRETAEKFRDHFIFEQ